MNGSNEQDLSPGQILKLIRTRSILTQDDLARELKESFGIQTTQVTLSRDIRELGLVKTPDGYRQVAGPRGRPGSGDGGGGISAGMRGWRRI